MRNRNPCKPFEDLDQLLAAPLLVRRSVTLPVSAGTLFDTLADAEAWSRWLPAIRRVEWTSPPPLGVGTTRTVTLLGGAAIDERFLFWEHGRRMAFTVTANTQRLFRSLGEVYEAHDHPEGTTLEWTMAIDPFDVMRPLTPLVQPLLGAALKAALWQLKRYLARR